MKLMGRADSRKRFLPHLVVKGRAEGGRLGRGPLHEGRYAVCPMHLYKFDVRDGAPQDVSCGHARTVRCEERDGNIEVYA